MATSTVTVRWQLRYSLAWLRLVKFVSPVLVPLFGYERVMDFGVSGVVRLMRVQVGNGPWHSLRAEWRHPSEEIR